MLFVTLEGIRSHTKGLIYAHLKRNLAARRDCVVLDVPNSDDPYDRALRIFKALKAVGKGAQIALCPASFYAHAPGVDRAVWIESVGALNAKLAPSVDEHLMVSIMSDEHSVFDENITKPNGASIEDISEAAAAVMETAKNPAGHPWRARSVIVPVPRFANDTPAFVEKISSDIATIVSRMVLGSAGPRA